MTILYDSRKTLKIIFSHRGTVWPRVFPFCAVVVGMTITVYFLKKEEMDVTFPLDGHKMLSVMVAYLVVSRADASYNRFWEARGLLLLALQTIRQISIHAAAFTNGDLQRQEGKARDRTNLWRIMLRQHLVHMVYTSVCVIKEEELTYDFTGVRMEEENEDSDSASGTGVTIENDGQFTKNRFESIPSLSHAIHKDIVMNALYLQKPLSVLHENRLHAFHCDYEKYVAELCKFATTPYPFPITQMTRIFLFLWMFTLPFALTHKATEPFTATILVFFIAYGFFGLEFVSIELDDPFGDDLNDLAIDEFAKTVVKGIMEDLTSDPPPTMSN